MVSNNNDNKICKCLQISVWTVDGTLTGTTDLRQSGPGSNGNEWVLHIPQWFRIEAARSNVVYCHTPEL